MIIIFKPFGDHCWVQSISIKSRLIRHILTYKNKVVSEIEIVPFTKQKKIEIVQLSKETLFRNIALRTPLTHVR